MSKGAAGKPLPKKLKESFFFLLEKKEYKPLSLKDLKEILSIKKSAYPGFDAWVKELHIKKKIKINRSKISLNKHAFKEDSDVELIEGKIFVNHKGFAFVHPQNPELAHVFIPKTKVLNAVDGDIVEVAILDSRSPKGPEGKVTRVVQRNKSSFFGVIHQRFSPGRYWVFSPSLGKTHPLLAKTSSEMKVDLGDRVMLSVDKWKTPQSPTEGTITEVLGSISDSTLDILCAIKDFKLPSAFPVELDKEIEKIPSRVGSKDLDGRLDLRDQTCVTIDPDTAKDFDDAISIKRSENGHFHLGVHIADVSHYVKEGSALDIEAKKRGNSTYLPGVCLPMLPYALSNELCSLKPQVNRLTVSVLMELDEEANLLDYKIKRAVIKSAKRFTYREAHEILKKQSSSPFSSMLEDMQALCLLLKAKRKARGSIEFSLPEAKVMVDEKGQTAGVDFIEYDITHQMIEEFMLKANEVIAKHLTDQGKTVPYRVHDEPKEENLQDFAFMASLFGYPIEDSPTQDDLQLLFDKLKDDPSNQRFLSILFIRSMQLASYSIDNIGHYGLSLEHYCHFTSPIRRYSDLIVHRLLFETEPTADDELREVAQHLSTTERQSSKAEISVSHLKKLRWLEEKHTKDPYHVFDALITLVKPHGIFFEVADILIEGFIHISRLDDDFFHFHSQSKELIGEHTGRELFIGQSIQVQIDKVDLIFSECNWVLLGAEKSSHKKKAKTKQKKKKSFNKKKSRRKK